MTTRTWRAVLLSLCVVIAAVDVTHVIGAAGIGGAPPWMGIWGMTPGATSQPFMLVVTSVDPGGPSDSAGLRRGDFIDIRATLPVERYSLIAQPLAGRPVALSIHRAAKWMRLTVTPSSTASNRWWYIEAAQAGILWMLLFAAVIAWRRAHVPETRLLCLTLIAFAIAYVASPGSSAAPWAWVYVVKSVALALTPLVLMLWVAFAGTFARPTSPSRRIAQVVCYALVAVTISIQIAATLGMLTLRWNPVPLLSASQNWYTAAVLAAVICSVLAIVAARGMERQRALWTLIPLALLLCINQAYNVISTSSSSYSAVYYWAIIVCSSTLVAPVILTYAALTKRLIDIGFVVNRAVVFAILSTVVVGAFVLAEWAAGAWFVGAGRNTSAAVGIGVALVLGLSLRYIHKYVDRFVDRVFFRKRYDDEAALRRFAHEASYITDREILLARTVHVVEVHTGGAASVLLQNDDRSYVSFDGAHGDRLTVGENDPAIVAMRAWHKQIDLQSVGDSAVLGQFAFPMVSRGSLVGILVCGAKNDDEAFAPDESDALAALAHGVGSALGSLTSIGGDGAESLRRTQERILDELRSLSEKLMAQARQPRPGIQGGDR